jgi:hypothetical protein
VLSTVEAAFPTFMTDIHMPSILAHRPASRMTATWRVVGSARPVQLGADRLDSEFQMMCVDVVDEQRCGLARSDAKKADADRKIAFGRHSSRFSASSSASCRSVDALAPAARWHDLGVLAHDVGDACVEA